MKKYIDIDAIVNALASLENSSIESANTTKDTQTSIEEIINITNDFKKYDNYEDINYEDIIVTTNDQTIKKTHKRDWYRWKTEGTEDITSICNSMKEYLEEIKSDLQELNTNLNEANLSIIEVTELLTKIYDGLGVSSNSNIENSLKNLILKSDFKVSEESMPEEGFSEWQVQYYNKLLTEYLSEHNNSQREKSVAAAIFLTTMFPKLPYFWGGGHDETKDELIGIDASWGTQKEIVFGGDEDYIIGSKWPKSLDCSGFVSWCMINADANINSCYSTTDFKTKGQLHSITEENIIDKVQIGDLADFARGAEHVGIIVNIEKENNTITVAHCSGSGKGMNLTTIDTQTGLVVADDVGLTGNSRVGEKYFENIILWNYNDESEDI